MAEHNTAGSSSNQNIMGALAYSLGAITGIIFLLVEKKNKFIRFHAMQSLIVFGGFFVISIVLGFVPVLGALVGTVLSFAAFILWIWLMIKAFQGEYYKLPYIGEVADKQLSNLK